MSEAHEHRLKRLRMRAWRRGTKEMDLILGPWADASLRTLPAEALDRFERLLEENDQELYGWISGQQGRPPGDLEGLIAEIGAHARARHLPFSPQVGD